MLPQREKKLPIFVDLDGTLIRGDMFLEAALLYVRQRFWNIFKLIYWLSRGRAVAKMMVARNVAIAPETLSYNQQVIDIIQERKRQGHPIHMATAAHGRTARSIAQYLGFFDSVLASTGKTNLKSDAKLQKIMDRSDGEFGYFGDSVADKKILTHAKFGGLVGGSSTLLRAIKNPHVEAYGERSAMILTWLRAMRVSHWSKNALIFVPLLVSHSYANVGAATAALIAFFCFGLCASGVYVFNDLTDIQSDRQHDKKKNRPLASGAMSVPEGILLAAALPAAGLGIALWLLPLSFVVTMFGYMALTASYSIWLKRRVLVDVYVLAALYTIRVIAGAAALGVLISFWLLGFSFLTFLSLAFLKRYEELSAKKSGKTLPGRGYAVADAAFVMMSGVGAGISSIIVLGLFVLSNSAQSTYQSPEALWLICPLFLYWINRMWLGAARGVIGYDPILFAIKDRVSQLIGVIAILLVLAARNLAFF